MLFFDREPLAAEWRLFKEFLESQGKFFSRITDQFLGWSGALKDTSTKLMYRQRGRFSGTFVHASMGTLAFLAVALSGYIEGLITHGQGRKETYAALIMAADAEANAMTQISTSEKGEITEYRVEDGDTVSSIAVKFNVSIDTIMWENELKNVDAIKPKQILRILPVTGMKHKVKRGETIYSIAKRYGVDAQAIIDYPFNTFSNDETFALSAGQELIVPGGIKPKETIIDTSRYVARTVAPVPGVVGEGGFIWPTTGHISQKYYWYHKAVDIANPSNPVIVASQGGTVVTAGWNGGGYGNYVIIDHGNGYTTLYAHMLNGSIAVKPGQ
jgi:LysM repeat protein